MICPECGNFVAASRNLCELCGYDLSVYKKIVRLSNSYYNQGLEKAKVRDLSGAVVLLKKSLEMNKKNTDARNLLGLVYFEMGEVVSAMSEWVISSNFSPDGNEADRYMAKIQANPAKLEELNQAIKKYNLALEAAKQGGADLAIIQLKKVVSLNPNYVKAHLLLSLLLMKNGEYERAKKYLLKIKSIDVSNTVMLRYLNEIERVLLQNEPVGANTQKQAVNEKQSNIKPEVKYKEDRPNIWLFLNLIFGVLLGVAVVFWLIVPSREKQIKNDYLAREIDYSAKLNDYLDEVNVLKNEKEGLQIRITELNKEISETKARVEYVNVEDPKHALFFDSFYKLLSEYVDFLKLADPTGEDYIKMAGRLLAFDINVVESASAKQMYKQMKEQVMVSASVAAYTIGLSNFEKEAYNLSLANMLDAYSFDSTYDRVIYYIARNYQALFETEKAIQYYELLLKECPESTLCAYAKDNIELLMGAGDESESDDEELQKPSEQGGQARNASEPDTQEPDTQEPDTQEPNTQEPNTQESDIQEPNE